MYLLSFLYSGGYTRLQGGRWSDSRALSCVERFDTFSQYWTTVSSLHQARCGLGVAVLGGMVYAIGGFVGKVMSLLLNMLSRLVITFLPRRKRILISWLQSPSAVILEPPKIKSATVSTVSPSICHEVMGPDAMIFIF